MNKILKKLFKVAMAVFGFAFFFSCSDQVDNPAEPVSDANVYVSQDEAIEIAKRFMKNNGPESAVTRAASGGNLKVVLTDIKAGTRAEANAHPSYYVINLDSTAYVVVSGSKVTYPVLGFSFDNPFITTSIPDGVQYMFDNYTVEVKDANNKIKPSTAIEDLRNAYLESTPTRAEAIVGPLLGRIKWNQQPYYNTYCPPGTPVGCVATATSQIMCLYKYPKRGTGSHSYYSSCGTLSFNYDYNIDWDAMPESVLRQRNDEVARFCYGVAVALDMSFSTSGSGTWQQYVPAALKKYYKYPSNVKSAERSSYSYNQWIALVKRELDAGHPVQYCGGGTGGAHSFVCDGYTSNNYFHFNWGWGGMSDGYFQLHALNPGSLGTGGGSGGGFNNNQSIVINFAPPGGVEPNPDPKPDPNPGPTEYCKSAATSPCTAYIRFVELGGMNNYSTCNSAGYSNFTSKYGMGYSGYNVRYTLSPDGRRGTNYWRVWIDFNNDKEFDSSELVVQKASTGTVYGYFALPRNLSKGFHRVRVSMKQGSYADSCDKFDVGEVEDYLLYVRY